MASHLLLIVSACALAQPDLEPGLVARVPGCAFSTLVKFGMAGAGVAGVGLNLISAYKNFTSPDGDPIMGVLDILDAGVGAYNISKFIQQSCFTAEMLLDCDGGKKRADPASATSMWNRFATPTLGRITRIPPPCSPMRPTWSRAAMRYSTVPWARSAGILPS